MSLSCASVSKAERGLQEPAFQSLVLSELRNLVELQASMRGLAERHHEEVVACLKGLQEGPAQDVAMLPCAAEGDWGSDTTVEHKWLGEQQKEPLIDSMEVTGGNGILEAAALPKPAEEDQEKRPSQQQQNPQECVPLGVQRTASTNSYTSHGGPPKSLREHCCTFLKGSLFDLIMGSTIMLNMCFLFTELQIQGSTVIKYDLELAPDTAYWDEAESFFVTAEYVFAVVYVGELIIRVGSHGIYHFHDRINVIDSVIVVIGAAQALMQAASGGNADVGPNMQFARVVKLFRIFRIVKMFKFMNNFAELRILLKTLAVSVWSLVWSMSLISVVVLTSGVLMFQLSVNIIEDDSRDMDMRLWMYENFGTAARSSWTMFECTFSGGWISKVNYVVMEVGASFAVFWITYIVLVNFAVMKVVGALFLKQTMTVASDDAERVVLEKMKHNKRYASQLQEIFSKADTSGDGIINLEEFEVMIDDPQILEMFAKMDIEVPEIKMLFQVLSEDDGETDYCEFLEGALKMKNSARCIDTIQIQHSLSTIKRTVLAYESNVEKVFGEVVKRMEHVDQMLQIVSKHGMTKSSRWGRQVASGSSPLPFEAVPSSGPAVRM